LTEIRPFRGTYYNTQLVGDLSLATAPPYDVVDQRRKRKLLSLSPYNVVRLELPQDETQREFWNRAAELFAAWKEEGVLLADRQPALYLCRQTFDLPGKREITRTGILAALKCSDYVGGNVLPHERTFSTVRVERLNLLRACRANFSQVFMSYRDPEGKVSGILEKAVNGPAFLCFTDEEGVRHELWRVIDPAVLGEVVEVFRDKRLIIADGHHRYETALTYARENPAPQGEGDAGEYVSVALFRSEDPGLVILPVHRLLRRLNMAPEEAYRRLERYLRVEAVQLAAAGRGGAAQEKLGRLPGPGMIMVTGRGAALLTLAEGVTAQEIVRIAGSDRLKGLDVSLLHYLVLNECLGLDDDRLAEEGALSFSPWESEVIGEVMEGRAEAAFLLRPTPMEDVWAVAEGGERMPYKSTYFYPKFPSGLVIYDHRSAFG
jgi:uncharacterized protein (DUF1015 family)